MAYFSREEQESHYWYDPIDQIWRIESTYPPHIKRIVERAHDIQALEDDQGRITLVKATASPGQIRIYFEK